MSLQTSSQTTYAGSDELWANEKYLVRYTQFVVDLLSKRYQPGERVLEFGAGIGTLAQYWFRRYGVRPDCLEIDPALRAVIIERGFNCATELDELEPRYDRIYSSNVLEHISDDVAILRRIRTKLCDAGTLALYVPASMLIYNDLDRAVGHYRRYGKMDLMRKLREAGFVIVDWSYVDCVGFFAWLSIRFRGYSPNRKLGSGGELSFYDRVLFPISRFLDSIGMRFLFGKNLLVIAKKSADLTNTAT